MKKLFLLPVLGAFLCVSCNRSGAENTDQKDQSEDAFMKELYAREKANEDRAKYGSSAEIKVISDAKELADLRSGIERKMEKKQREDAQKAEKTTLEGQYKKGDKTVVPKILAVLKGKDKKARRKLYYGLQRDFEDPENYTITEPELIALILKNINDPDDEEPVVQLAGYNKITGYEKAFESRLLSGKSTDAARIVFWLGKDGKSVKTFDFVEKQIRESSFDLEENPDWLTGVKYFAESGNSKMKERAFLLCYELYTSKRIDQKNYNEMKTGSSSDNPAEDVTEVLFKYGDKRVIPIAEEYLKKEIRESDAMNALIRLEGARYKPQVLELLADEKKFTDGLFSAKVLNEAAPDKELPVHILQCYENQKEHESYQTERVVATLMEMNATVYLDNPSLALKKDKKLMEDIRNAYLIAKSTPETIAKDLLDMGVINKPVSAEVIKKAKEEMDKENEEYSSGNNGLIPLLNACGIYHWFDAETGMVPVDYDVLIKELARKSNGKLKDITVWMDAIGGVAEDAPIDAVKGENGEVMLQGGEDEKIDYTIYLLTADKAYAVSPEDIGDWYDVGAVVKLLNKALADSGAKERYVFLDTGDQTVQLMFGPEENIKRFAAKYRLESN